MKSLKDILDKVSVRQLIGSVETEVSSLAFDSRKAGEGTAFVAVRGTESDGHIFISQAAGKGASVIICEDLPADLLEGLTYVQVEDSAKALGLMAANFFGHPSTN